MEQVDNDSLVGLLDQLVQPQPPQPVSMVPQTWGWVVLLVLALLICAFLVRRILIRRRANAYRREALDLLRAAKGDPARVAEILRRTALVAYPREVVAGLKGEAWLRFLDRQIGQSGFEQGPGRVVAAAPYVRTDAGAGLSQLAENWIRHHSVKLVR